jgi:hypothetical protein
MHLEPRFWTVKLNFQLFYSLNATLSGKFFFAEMLNNWLFIAVLLVTREFENTHWNAEL